MRWPFSSASALTQDRTDTSASSNSRFAFRLFQELGPTSAVPNVFFSPASVALCLALLHEGASGDTRAAMAKVLEVDGLESQESLSRVASLRSSLQCDGPNLQLETANSLWCSQVLAFRSEYIDKAKNDYLAELKSLDLTNPRAVGMINSWIAQKTRGKIQSVLDTLDPLTSLVAVNAIYFKDLWQMPFPPCTTDEPFRTDDGRLLKVPLMLQYGFFSYYEEKRFQAVLLPYQTSHLGMYIFLPSKTSSLAEFLQHLDGAAWDYCTKRLERQEGLLRVPRFKTQSGSDLRTPLASLGMGIAFDAERARFEGIHSTPPQIWIDQVRHQASIEVTEEGTEATAATWGLAKCFGGESPKRSRTFEMIINRPFFLAISNIQTNTILFMGSIQEPTW